jgi:hypothetical protein
LDDVGKRMEEKGSESFLVEVEGGREKATESVL